MIELFDKYFSILYLQAERLISSDTLVSKLLDKAFIKIGKVTEDFYYVQDNILALIRMLKNWMSGDYKNISIPNVVAAVAALIYFVSPIDFIPDFIPFIGKKDDKLFLNFMIKKMNFEIDKFMAWERDNIK